MKKKLILTAVALTMSFSLVACGGNKTSTQTNAESTVLKGEAQGYKGPISVKVTKEGDKITKVEVGENQETPNIGGEALKTLTAAVAEKGTVKGVDAVGGATVTSEAFFKAIKEAK